MPLLNGVAWDRSSSTARCCAYQRAVRVAGADDCRLVVEASEHAGGCDLVELATAEPGEQRDVGEDVRPAAGVSDVPIGFRCSTHADLQSLRPTGCDRLTLRPTRQHGRPHRGHVLPRWPKRQSAGAPTSSTPFPPPPGGRRSAGSPRTGRLKGLRGGQQVAGVLGWR